MLVRTFLLSAAFCGLLISGCNPSSPDGDDVSTNTPTHSAPDEHADPHDVPLTDAEIESLRKDTATWSAAMEHIKKYRDTIRTETTTGTPAHAHRSLDLLDHVLEWLPQIAQDGNVPKDSWQTVGENGPKLRDSFNNIHANIDAGNPPDYESEAAEIDAAINALDAIEPGDSTDSN